MHVATERSSWILVLWWKSSIVQILFKASSTANPGSRIGFDGGLGQEWRFESLLQDSAWIVLV